MTEPDDDREVPLLDDTDIVVLPDETTDDTEEGWLGYGDERTADPIHERPPHWGE
jgi:hypothetical protein